jgi:hypothetical protein
MSQSKNLYYKTQYQIALLLNSISQATINTNPSQALLKNRKEKGNTL